MEKMQFELQALIFGDNKKGIQKRKLSLEEKRSILLKVLKGLQKLHSQQFVHCDMKWSNAMMNTIDGKSQGAIKEVKLIDYGISKFLKNKNTMTHGEISGMSARYSAPEYIKDETVSNKCDVII